MSKVHVLIPYTTEVACGEKSHYINGSFRSQITCPKCKKTPFFKDLPQLPRKFRK
jgi:hypothetical protein